MASIIAGRTYSVSGSGVSAAFTGTGHAPDAELVDVACSSYQGQTALTTWIFTDAGYLGGIEVLREWILETDQPVHVANLSIFGEASPDHLISVALDNLARTDDILLVTCGGNVPDTTEGSNGFYHGLAVASVHARHPGNLPLSQPANLAFVPMRDTSRGPLFSDHRRFYPDVCATGAGPGSFDPTSNPTLRRFRYPGDFNDSQARGSCLAMPGVDILDPLARASGANPPNNVSPDRFNLGTSEAAAQVSGAAALYRGKLPAATAEETRAAILLNVLGTFAATDGLTADTSLQHAYTNRNTFGVGYVRDDLLAQFAMRAPATHHLVRVETLSAAVPSVSVTYNNNLASGARYGVVACWRRWHGEEGEEPQEQALPDVNLEVLHQGSVIARSTSPANSYERLVFVAPSVAGGSPTVDIRVWINDVPMPNQALPVQIVAREFATDIDPATAADPVHAASGQVASTSAGALCTAQSTEWQVDRIVPIDYGNAYGSAPFEVTWQPVFQRWFEHVSFNKGFDLATGRHADHPVGQPNNTVQIVISQNQMGGAISIGGLAFRTWAPFATSVDLTATVLAFQGTHSPNLSPPGGATLVASNASFRAVGSNAGECNFDKFAVLLPFTATFNYAATGGPLNLWITVATNAPAFIVDGINDPEVTNPDSSYYRRANPLNGSVQLVTLDGIVPILGLIAASPVAAREPLLEIFGEPWSGTGAARDIDWRLSQVPVVPNGIGWGLFWGAPSGTGTQFGSCKFWLANATTFASGITTSGLVEGRIAFPAGFVHYDFALQAALVPSPFSNAVRVTVGGGL